MKALIALLILSASTAACGPSSTTGGSGGGGAGPGWGARVDLSPQADSNNVLVGGRFASVVVHPTTPGLAFAAAESGGIYSTTDKGQTWTGTNNPDGSLASIGQGFAGTGVNEFSQMAINAKGAMVVLAGIGGNSLWQSAPTATGPTWRSMDAGATWQPAMNVNPPPPPYGIDGQIAFSPATTRAYANIGDRLGSTPPNTDGDQWTWTTPVPGAVHINGLDIFPAGSGPNPFNDSTGDILAFTMWDGTHRWLELLDTNGNQIKKYQGPTADMSIAPSAAQVVFDPNNSFHVFMASNNDNTSQISEGIISSDVIVWTDLTQGKSWNNGRPAWVQTHVHPGDETQVDIYYHDSAHLWTMTCPVASVCPATATWTQIVTVHGDISRIAFDPQTGCPLIIADDGGLEVPTTGSGCNATWGTAKSGLHALEPYNASFAQGNGTRSILLDLQDNGTFAATAPLSTTGPGKLSWVQFADGDGHWSTMYPPDPSMGLASSNGNLVEYNPVPTVANPMLTLPAGVGTPLDTLTASDKKAILGFLSQGLLEFPALDGNGHLQMWLYKTDTNTVLSLGTAFAGQIFDTTQLASDFATAGGPGATLANAYLAYRNGLYAFSGSSLQWTLLFGGVGQPQQPYRVWGDLSGQVTDAGRYYVLDSSNSTMWFATDGGPPTQDMNLTMAAAGATATTLPTDPCPGHVCSVAWDITDPNRIAVGTDHNGILFTSNGDCTSHGTCAPNVGPSWSVNSVPEPNGGVTGVSLEPGKGSSTANALVSIWGEGVWAIALQAMVLQIRTVSGPSISGSLLDSAHRPMVGAPLELRVYGRDLLEANLTADARLQERSDAVPHDAGTRSRVAPRLSAVDTPPNPVVFDGPASARTDARGDFTVTMPSLPAGRYFVQVIFPGDSGNPRTTVGTDYTVR